MTKNNFERDFQLFVKWFSPFCLKRQQLKSIFRIYHKQVKSIESLDYGCLDMNGYIKRGPFKKEGIKNPYNKWKNLEKINIIFLRLMGCESSTETEFIYDDKRQEDEKKNTISTYPSNAARVMSICLVGVE